MLDAVARNNISHNTANNRERTPGGHPHGAGRLVISARQLDVLSLAFKVVVDAR